MYRPRGVLAKTLYSKCLADEKLEMFEKDKWYFCDLTGLHGDIALLFLPLNMDEETHVFLNKAITKSEWVLTQIWHSVARVLLSWFLSQTSINGLLGRGSMFVFSRGQFLRLLATNSDWRRESLLDLGAGDGATTEIIAPLFKRVFTTEVSPPMRWTLQRKGFSILHAEEWKKSEMQYDVITCLNLLDRCDHPWSLLRSLRAALAPNGRLVVALVLPFQPYVEIGRVDHQPSERLPIQGSTFEEQAQSAIEDVFVPAGFIVLCWTRLPYLCEGDLNQAYYWLDDAVFVLQV
ncbi:methyltransferase-like protein 9 [Gryllus bimaculatus]|nr:methyltransferase-like protein 9 [Gryllus bimaculatus]